jgi:hypothetical protein
MNSATSTFITAISCSNRRLMAGILANSAPATGEALATLEAGADSAGIGARCSGVVALLVLVGVTVPSPLSLGLAPLLLAPLLLAPLLLAPRSLALLALALLLLAPLSLALAPLLLAPPFDALPRGAAQGRLPCGRSPGMHRPVLWSVAVVAVSCVVV